jgi:hypothetical protein
MATYYFFLQSHALGKGGVYMQQPRAAGQVLQGGVDGYEQMVNTIAENAKAYWRMWGPVGVPMIQSIDAWAQMQRAYLRELGVNGSEARNGRVPQVIPPAKLPMPLLPP